MKRARAHSRCEIDGKVYNPGDEMLVTEAQLAFLKDESAASEIVLHSATPVMVNPDATLADVAAFHEKVTGKILPTKERRK